MTDRKWPVCGRCSNPAVRRSGNTWEATRPLGAGLAIAAPTARGEAAGESDHRTSSWTITLSRSCDSTSTTPGWSRLTIGNSVWPASYSSSCSGVE